MNIQQLDNHLAGFLIEKKYRIYRHLLLIVGAIPITAVVLWINPEKFISFYGRIILFAGYLVSFLAILYLNIYYSVPKFLLYNHFFRYILAVAGSILCFLLLIIFIQQQIYTPETIENANYWLILFSSVSSLFSVGLLIAGTSSVLLFRHWVIYNRQITALESSTLETELTFLKKQINPHFLFNMLNNANVLIRKTPREATHVLFKLEDMLRYQIEESSREKVYLHDEIIFLEDFLNLEKIRRDAFEFSIRTEGNQNEIQIPPLLFIPFVENAVKHNPGIDNGSYIHILFVTEKNRVYFRCTNSRPEIKYATDTTGGLGLANIRRRLELLFPNRHTLFIRENEKEFDVELTLEL